MKKTGLILTSAAFLASTIALPVMAQATSTMPGSAKNKIDAACMQAAVDKRDSAIIVGVSSYASAIGSALSARKDALKAAWGLSAAKNRRAGLRAAWSAYRSALSSARNTLKNVKQNAWDTFYADRKTCGPTNAAEDSTTHGIDTAL